MEIKPNIAISDSGFVFDPSTGESFTFNPTGLEIFRLMKEGRKMDEISEIITMKYQVEKHSFDRYFVEFLQMLKQYQLITIE